MPKNMCRNDCSYDSFGNFIIASLIFTDAITDKYLSNFDISIPKLLSLSIKWGIELL